MPTLPPFSKPVIAAAIVLDIVVFAMGIRAFPVLVFMLLANLAVCLVIYWTILGHFFGRQPAEADQSPSRKSSPISE
ncbi:hypothetical protein [Rhodovulum euryhalinum]|uniref:Uncharacterized protein n=1 Tax=Rhodovulum euryhalinum TaxID=35805 RepID=A0A4R2KB24_9RHOB|nr:hypothetical protein [Rhodovulum euryhalinum]TCO69984.1 hypothetical protein EV655_112112 [Rhodovulum euryhalinum]